MINKSHLNTSTPRQLENEAVAGLLLAHEIKVCEHVEYITQCVLYECCTYRTSCPMNMRLAHPICSHALPQNRKPLLARFPNNEIRPVQSFVLTVSPDLP